MQIVIWILIVAYSLVGIYNFVNVFDEEETIDRVCSFIALILHVLTIYVLVMAR